MQSAPSMDDCLKIKSAKKWLKEVAGLQPAQVKWKTFRANRGSNPPKYLSRCLVTFEVEGSGSSKREAEENAALSFLTDEFKMTPSTLMALHHSTSETDEGDGERFEDAEQFDDADQFEDAEQFEDSEQFDNGERVGYDKCEGDGEHVVDGDVSDTDDFEVQDIYNPIGELKGILEQKKLWDVEYVDGPINGPQHRKIFVVTCKATMMDGREIAFSCRRYSKKLAKKIAAFRVLRVVYNILGNFGDAGDPNEETEGATSETSGISKNAQKKSKNEAFDLNDVKGEIEAAACEYEPSIVEAKPKRGIVPCKNDVVTCPELMDDFIHVFAHVQTSETLEKILKADSLAEFTEGPMAAMDQLARETGVRISYSKAPNIPPTCGLPFLVILELVFQVTIDYSVVLTNKETVHGVGFTEIHAKVNAAKAALNYLRDRTELTTAS